MSVHRFSVHVAARQERTFDLWTDLGRLPEWVEGVTRVTDVTGPSDRVGTRHTVWFGSMRFLVGFFFLALLLYGDNDVRSPPERGRGDAR